MARLVGPSFLLPRSTSGFSIQVKIVPKFIDFATKSIRSQAWFYTLAICALLYSNATQGDELAKELPVRQPVKLPGLEIDFQKRCVDLDATVCLDQGFLELVACSKGSKEHESIVAIDARLMHVHTALLLLGANNGNPAMRKAVEDEKKTRWVHVPPQGDLIDVFLVTTVKDGKSIERPISDFIKRANDRVDEVDGVVIEAPTTADLRAANERAGKKEERLPRSFVFAGSHLRSNGNGPRQYMADSSGHAISIATFGDELLCLLGIQSPENGALSWQIDSTHLPKVGTKVTLRLRPQLNDKKPESKAKPESKVKSESTAELETKAKTETQKNFERK